MPNCINCGKSVTDNFCSHCGQPVIVKRIDSHYIMHSIQHVLHLEKGIFYTVRELLIRPGQNVKEFLSLNRNRLVKPVIFIIVTSLLYSLAAHFFHVEDGYVSVNVDEANKRTATLAISQWIQTHYGYANIIMGIFIAVWLKLFFRKYAYNFFEILILLCFIMGMGMLVLALFALVEGITGWKIMQTGGIIFFLYATWGIGQFFDSRKIISYLKALGAYLAGMITFTMGTLLVGYIIDLIINR